MKKTVRRVRLADFIFALITVVVVFIIMVLIVTKSEAADKAYMQEYGKTGMEYAADAGELEFTDSDERAEVLEEAELDPDNYDFG